MSRPVTKRYLKITESKYPISRAERKGARDVRREMVQRVQELLRSGGVEDRVVAAGQFMPRGPTGGTLVGSLAGGEAGASGWPPARRPACMPPTPRPGCRAICWSASRRAPSTPSRRTASRGSRRPWLSRCRRGPDREGPPRVNVRVLELIGDASGARIELEGSRVPITDSKDVIAALTS